MGDKDWIIELSEELENKVEVSQDKPEWWKKRSIYRIPAHIANPKKEAYKPRLVSLGPYHHGDVHLKAMEGHKHRALRLYLHRSEKPLHCYVGAMAEVVQDLMDAYDQLEIAWKQDVKGFLQLMIVDGCFILETMRVATQTVDGYSPDDPIFGHHGKLNVIPYVRLDMLLLENQVPLLVLERLLAVECGAIEQNEKQVTRLILKFCLQDGIQRQTGKCLHILDEYRKNLIRDVPKEKPKRKKKPTTGRSTVGYCATDLKEAGIKFRMSKTPSLNNISFTGSTLRLPLIVLDDATELLFLNLVAFKQLHVGAGSEIRSYIFFMNSLLSNVKDVHLLDSDGVILNAMACDEDVVQLFLNLSREITVDDSKLDEVYLTVSSKLGNHFRRKLSKWRYNLFHTYFRSPWAIISVVAAAFGLGLSISQTLFSILSYIHRNHVN